MRSKDNEYVKNCMRLDPGAEEMELVGLYQGMDQDCDGFVTYAEYAEEWLLDTEHAISEAIHDAKGEPSLKRNKTARFDMKAILAA